MENRKFVYAFVNAHNTVSIVNYDAGNSAVNTFLWRFDLWGSNGEFKPSIDHKHQEVWFECESDIMPMLKSPIFERAFAMMGVKLVFEYPFASQENSCWLFASLDEIIDMC